MNRHLFFDLDRTLWDYDRNVKETLADLHKTYLVAEGVEDLEHFSRVFHQENKLLWDAFTKNEIDKDHLRKFRFHNTLKLLGLDNQDLALEIEKIYLELTPVKKGLFPGVHKTLGELSKRYTLHIITNGFEEVQNFKLHNSGIRSYFKDVITSDGANARKPNKEIFDYSMQLTGAKREDCIMIGDDYEVDILGAQKAGWEAILFNPTGIIYQLYNCREINQLTQLLEIL